MGPRIGIVLCSLAVAVLGGCATGASSGPNQSFMSQCEAKASNEQERSECAWKNAERNASGR
jgi:hypothetical protein